MVDVSLITLATAFFAGVLMFLAPCTLPIIPALLASLVPGTDPSRFQRRVLLRRSFLFAFGFSTIFVSFGVLAGIFGQIFSSYRLIMSQIGGVLVILLGLSILGVFSVPFMTRSTQTHVRAPLIERHVPFVLGALFALGWTPCAGPLLASVLIFGSTTANIVSSTFVLIAFALGLAIPFILMGVFFGSALQFIQKYARIYRGVQRLSGIFLVLLGVFLVFGDMIRLTHFGFLLYDFLGVAPMCTYF